MFNISFINSKLITLISNNEITTLLLKLFLFAYSNNLIYFIVIFFSLSMFLLNNGRIYKEAENIDGTTTSVGTYNLGRKLFAFIMFLLFPCFEILFFLNVFLNRSHFKDLIFSFTNNYFAMVGVLCLLNICLCLYNILMYLLSSTIDLHRVKSIDVFDTKYDPKYFKGHILINNKIIHEDKYDNDKDFTYQYIIYRTNTTKNSNYLLVEEVHHPNISGNSHKSNPIKKHFSS